jgi:hypothetical protein
MILKYSFILLGLLVPGIISAQTPNYSDRIQEYKYHQTQHLGDRIKQYGNRENNRDDQWFSDWLDATELKEDPGKFVMPYETFRPEYRLHYGNEKILSIDYNGKAIYFIQEVSDDHGGTYSSLSIPGGGWTCIPTRNDTFHILTISCSADGSAPVFTYDPPKETPTTIYFTGDNGMPTVLYINGETWSIKKVTSSDELSPASANFTTLATTYCSSKTIKYISTYPSLNMLRVNMMHEIFHAGACNHNAKWWNSTDDSNEGHPGVYNLGVFMYQFLHDNPDFAEWVAK